MDLPISEMILLPQSRSTELLGESAQEILASETYQRLVLQGTAAAMGQRGMPNGRRF
jgi:hypothetical protein